MFVVKIKEFGPAKTARRGFDIQPTTEGKKIKEFGLAKTARRGFDIQLKCSQPSSSQLTDLRSSQTGFIGSSSQGDGTPNRALEEIIQGSQRFNPREMGEVVASAYERMAFYL